MANAATKKIFALKASASIAGVERKKEKISTERDGESVTTDSKVTESIAHVRLHASAKAFRNAVTGLSDRFGVYSEALDAYLTDEVGAAKFERALNQLREEISEFNGQIGNPHTVTIAPYSKARCYSTTFDARDFAALYESCATELSAARAALEAGDLETVTAWLKRNARLPATLPALNANVVTSAVNAIRECKNTVAARVRLGESLEVCRQCSEFAAMVDAVESALGWCVPQSVADIKAALAV
jgi:hypothetical protein